MTNASRHMAFWGRGGRLWSFCVALLLAAQVGLGVHQLEHRFNPDAVTADDCALCHFATHMVAAPEPVAFVPPALVVTAYIDALPQTIVRPQRAVAGFRSRAPPISVSA